MLLLGVAGCGKTALLRTIAYRHALAKSGGKPSTKAVGVTAGLEADDGFGPFRIFSRVIVLRLRDVQVR